MSGNHKPRKALDIRYYEQIEMHLQEITGRDVQGATAK